MRPEGPQTNAVHQLVQTLAPQVLALPQKKKTGRQTMNLVFRLIYQSLSIDEMCSQFQSVRAPTRGALRIKYKEVITDRTTGGWGDKYFFAQNIRGGFPKEVQ